MSVVVFPVDAVAGAPSYTGEMLRQALAVDLKGATSARPLGARSGVRPGTSTTGTVTITGTGPYTVNINPHGGVLDLETSATAGPYRYSINTTQSFTITAQGGSPRTDVVYLQLNDPAESDGSSTPAVVPGYQSGTSSVPNSRCLLLATLNVPAAGTAPTVTWAAPFMAAAGGVRMVPVIGSEGAGNHDGEAAWALDLRRLYDWNATGGAWELLADPAAFTAWTNYTPVWTSESGGTTAIGTGGVLSGRFKKVGLTCDGWVNMLVGASASGPAGVWNWTLPAVAPAALQAGANVDVPIGSGTYFGPTGGVLHGDVYARYSSGGTKFVVQFHGQSAPAQPNNPSTWPANARMMVNFRYETAS